jgi:shikimate kinase
MNETILPGLNRSIVLVGLMGAGKSSVGKRLAARIGLPFVDADTEIEKAAGHSIEDFFRLYGEAAFREGERRVIARLLTGPVQVLATGGGSFMDPETRAEIAAHGISVWLRADLDVLLRRVMRRNDRPLLKQGDPKTVLSDLMAKRYPIYAEADIVIDSGDGPHEVVVESIVAALRAHLGHDREHGEFAGSGAQP